MGRSATGAGMLLETGLRARLARLCRWRPSARGMTQDVTLSNFVFVHSVPLIDLLERRNAFAGLGGHTYVLLGPRERHEQPLASSPNRGNVIFAALLPDNIEDQGNCLQFTGWYALANNPLIGDGVDYVGLYEYDIEVTAGFDGEVRRALGDDPERDITGFLAYPKSWMLLDRTDRFCEPITRFLEERLHIGAEDFLLNRTPAFFSWIGTSNVIIGRRRFLEFMWSGFMGELLDFLDNDKMSGHALERSISLYFMLNGWRAGVIQGQLSHLNADSHGTQDHRDRFERHFGV